MLNNDKGNAAVLRHLRQELLKGFQPACRSADGGNRKGYRFDFRGRSFFGIFSSFFKEPASSLSFSIMLFIPVFQTVTFNRHLVDRIPVADLRDEYKLQPTVFLSKTERVFFKNEATAFEKVSLSSRESGVNFTFDDTSR